MNKQIMLKFTQEEIENDDLGLNKRIDNIVRNNMMKTPYIVIIEIREKND